MPKFRLSKLVRDKIVDHQFASGSKPQYRKLTLEEHKHALINKIIEEVQEISRGDPNDVAAEITDVQQAIDDLQRLYGLTRKDIVQAQKTKNAKNGAFKEGLFIDSVEVEENDPWVAYYRKDPVRFPEIT